jgi:Peptidase family M28
VRTTTRWAVALAAAASAAPAAAQVQRPEGPLTHAARPTSTPISAEDLRTHVYILAADSMMGRQVGERGHVMGTDYIAAQAQRIGLRPAGENGTFFQNVPLVEHGLAPGAALSVGPQALAAGADFIPLPQIGEFLRFRGDFTAQGVPVVYGGRVGGTMIDPAQAAGKVVVIEGAAAQNGFAIWGGGTYAQYGAASLLVFATLDDTPPQLREYFGESRLELDHGDAAAASATQSPPAVIATRAAAERMLGGPLAGRQVGAAGGTVSGSFRFAATPPAFPSRNVIGIVPGSDPALRGEYVAIGAHSDHVGTGSPVDHDSLLVFNRILRPQGADQQPDAYTPETEAAVRAALAARRAQHPARVDSIFNGADDDASGSAGMLEMAQYLMANRPRRSVLFVWHAAEEAGLYGSEHFTDHPTVSRDSIVAQLNIDMIGRGAAGDVEKGGAQYLELVGSRRLSTQMGDLVEEVNRTGGFGFQFDYGMDTPGHPQQIYCRSDHANYARYGIPVTFFTTGGHSDYHQLTDEAQYIDYDKLANVSRLVASVAQTIGNRDARLVVDKPVSGPDAPCRQ